MKIYAVIVTFNRLAVLKRSMEAVRAQTRTPDSIIVVNNCSTYGTAEYLDGLAAAGAVVHLPLPRNVGGAGGFKAGLKYAVEDGCDWAWLMDDDTIPRPDALAQLELASSAAPDVGFVCSKAVWTDGKVHRMNIPGFYAPSKYEPINRFSRPDCPVFTCSQATFVSFMVSAVAVRKVGLPLEELFIWSDDIEYSRRIVKEGGMLGMYIDDSIVVHATATNTGGTWATSPQSECWKFFYQARNERYLTGRNRLWIVRLLSNLNYIRRMRRRINRRPGNDRKEFRKVLWKGTVASMTFKTKVDYVDDSKKLL